MKKLLATLLTLGVMLTGVTAAAQSKPAHNDLGVKTIKAGHGGVAFALSGQVDKESVTLELLRETAAAVRGTRADKNDAGTGDVSIMGSSGDWGPALRNKPTLDSSLRAEIEGTYNYSTPSFKVLEIEGVHQTKWLGTDPWNAERAQQTDTWTVSGKQVTYSSGGGGVVGSGNQASWSSGWEDDVWIIYHDYTGSPTTFTAPLDGWVTYFTAGTSGSYKLNGSYYDVGITINPNYV